MPGNAQTFWTNVVTDATAPADTATNAGIVEKVAISPYAQNVTVIAQVTVTIDADATAIVVQMNYGTIAAPVPFGDEIAFASGGAQTSTLPFISRGQLPVGEHSIMLSVVATDASGVTSIDAVLVIVQVGD